MENKHPCGEHDLRIKQLEDFKTKQENENKEVKDELKKQEVRDERLETLISNINKSLNNNTEAFNKLSNTVNKIDKNQCVMSEKLQMLIENDKAQDKKMKKFEDSSKIDKWRIIDKIIWWILGLGLGYISIAIKSTGNIIK